MKKPVIQKDNMGCGAACLAFFVGCTYDKASQLLQGNQTRADLRGFFCRDIVLALKITKKDYYHLYIKSRKRKFIYRDGVIVFIKKSKNYPAGHYLCRYHGRWMDPWINFLDNRDIKQAKAGFRKRLPGKPIYAICPHNSKID